MPLVVFFGGFEKAARGRPSRILLLGSWFPGMLRRSSAWSILVDSSLHAAANAEAVEAVARSANLTSLVFHGGSFRIGLAIFVDPRPFYEAEFFYKSAWRNRATGS